MRCEQLHACGKCVRVLVCLFVTADFGNWPIYVCEWARLCVCTLKQKVIHWKRMQMVRGNNLSGLFTFIQIKQHEKMTIMWYLCRCSRLIFTCRNNVDHWQRLICWPCKISCFSSLLQVYALLCTVLRF